MKIKNIDNKNIKTISDYIANHFNFKYIEPTAVSYPGLENKLTINERERIAYYFKKNDLQKRKNNPKFYFYNKPILNPKNFENKNNFGLDIYNVSDPIAEGLLLITINNILKINGYGNYIFEINSFGDTESLKTFKKELSNYYKKKEIFSQLTHTEKSKLPKDPLSLLFSKKDFMIEINKEAPKPIAFLSKNSSDFFGSIIEFLDSLNIPYRINDSLLDPEKVFNDFIFRVIKNSNNNENVNVLAYGGRYDQLAKKESGKKTTTAVGASLSIDHDKKKIKLTKDDINFHLLKIGKGPEINFLKIVEIFLELRKPITFYPTNNKITLQLEAAIEDSAEYSIILGQKEFLEKSVLVRKMEDKSQITIKQDKLKEYLQKTFGFEK